MSRILCTFPGRYGDLLWSLSVVRAISEAAGEPVDLQIAGEFQSIVPLLQQQSYLDRVIADPTWGLTPPDEWRAPLLDSDPVHDWRIQLGYRGWPDQPLPQFVYAQTRREYPDLPLASLDLDRPWITIDPWPWARERFMAVGGWSDCWFELKFGLWELVADTTFGLLCPIVCPPGSRWDRENPPRPIGEGPNVCTTDWLDAARYVHNAELFLGDCSALHVLAVALGKPVVLVEPMEARWNAIFYPLGKTGRVRLVTGNDGQPTFDARHVADVLREVLSHAS